MNGILNNLLIGGMKIEITNEGNIIVTRSDENKIAYGDLRKTDFEINKVIFNPPATIVFWEDGTKTVVKAYDETFDPEKGLAMAISKKALGNKGNYFNQIKKWTDTYAEPDEVEFEGLTLLSDLMGRIRNGLTAVKQCNTRIEEAQHCLVAALNNKKVTKEDLLAACKESREYIASAKWNHYTLSAYDVLDNILKVKRPLKRDIIDAVETAITYLNNSLYY